MCWIGFLVILPSKAILQRLKRSKVFLWLFSTNNGQMSAGYGIMRDWIIIKKKKPLIYILNDRIWHLTIFVEVCRGTLFILNSGNSIYWNLTRILGMFSKPIREVESQKYVATTGRQKRVRIMFRRIWDL